MKKQITIGDYQYEIDYTSVNAFKVLDLVLSWMQEHSASSSGEGIHQDDNCLIDAPTLVSDIVDDVLSPKCLNPDCDDEDF